MKFRNLLLVPLSCLLMAFTDAKVNTDSVDTLNASLTDMLQPLTSAQRLELMTAFFEISSGVFWVDSERSLASHYLGNQRFGSNYRRQNLYGQEFGTTSRESMVNFISKYGSSVNGKSGHQIMAEAKAKRAAREARLDANALANGPRHADQLEAEIRRYERFLPERRAEVESAFKKNEGKAERGMSRVKLLKVNDWSVIRDIVYANFDIEVDARTDRPLHNMHVKFFIHHKGNIDERGGGAAFVIKGSEVPGHKAANMRFNTGEMSFGIATHNNHPMTADGWEIIPFVSQISMKRKTDYVASGSDIYEFVKDGSSEDRGIAMTYCDAAIGQGKLNAPQLRAGVRGETLDTEHWKHAKYYCELGRKMAHGGSNPIMTPIYVPRDSALASTISASTVAKPPSSGAGTTETSNAAAAGNSTVDRLNNALGYIRIQNIEEFKVGQSPINPDKTKILAKMDMAIHNIPAKKVKLAPFSILVQLKSDPSQYMIIGKRYRTGNQSNSDPIMKVKVTGITGSSNGVLNWTSSNPNDYIFTPYLKEISWRDRTREKYVHSTREIVERITNP